MVRKREPNLSRKTAISRRNRLQKALEIEPLVGYIIRFPSEKATKRRESSCTRLSEIPEENAWPVVVEEKAAARSAARNAGCVAGSVIARSKIRL
jgi:hypothetical protein